MRSKTFTQIKNRLRKAVYHSLHNNDANLPLLFIHTPKTGGTSFRVSAEASKKIKKVYCDYGEDNNKTTPYLNTLCYKQSHSDDELRAFFERKRDFMLSGHFGADKYMQYFLPCQSIIFIREPVDRVVSEYYHKTRMGEYSGCIEDFVREPRYKNVQYHQFGSLHPVYFGVVGICEQYTESLELINALHNLDLKQFRENQNPGRIKGGYYVDDSIREIIIQNNPKDIALYRRCQDLLAYRLANKDHWFDWLYGGWRMTQNTIIGKAFKAYSSTHVTLDLVVNNKVVAKQKADKHRPIVCRGVVQPLAGNIGFEFPLNQIAPLSEGDSIEVICTSSGQQLFRMD